MDKYNITIGLIVLLALIGLYFFVPSPHYVGLGTPTFDIVLDNQDFKSHEVILEVSDLNDIIIFNETSIIPSKENRYYSNITTENGIYLVKVTIDGNITKTEELNYNEGKMLSVMIYPENVNFSISMP